MIKTQYLTGVIGGKKSMVEIDSVPLNQQDIHPGLR
jgi:hypothetical protein